jgi:hypothetical protein
MNTVEIMYDAPNKEAYQAEAFAVGLMGQLVGAAIKNITYDSEKRAGFVTFEIKNAAKAHELAKNAAASEITVAAKVITTTTYPGKFDQ